jgi:hypothetical protein
MSNSKSTLKSTPAFQVNDRVEAFWRDDGEWHPAEVLKVVPNNRFRIRFDGYRENYVFKMQDLRVPGQDSARAGGGHKRTFVLPAIPAAPLTPITALPQEPPQPELTVLPEATESSALLCSDMSKSKELVSAGGSASSQGVPALVIDGMPRNFPERSVEGALDSFFVRFAIKNRLHPPSTCAVQLISKDRSSGKVVMGLSSSCASYHISEDVCNDLASSLGTVRLHCITINCFPSLLVGTAALCSPRF